LHMSLVFGRGCAEVLGVGTVPLFKNK